MRKKGLSEVMVRAVMSLYDGAKTRARVRSAYSEEFEVKIGVHQESVLSPLLFAIVVDVITEKARSVANELLYVDDLVLMSETTEDLIERFWNLKDTLENKGSKTNIRKTKVMVSGSEGELYKSKVDPCGICGRKVMVNLVLRTKCEK